MEVIKFEKANRDKQGYLKILLKFGYELTIADRMDKLEDIRSSISWMIAENKKKYHIKTDYFDNILLIDNVVSMEIYEKERDEKCII